MQDLINLITQNGIGIVCVGFMIYFINSTMKDNNKILDEIQKTLVAIQTTLALQSTKISELESQINRKKGD